MEWWQKEWPYDTTLVASPSPHRFRQLQFSIMQLLPANMDAELILRSLFQLAQFFMHENTPESNIFFCMQRPTYGPAEMINWQNT